AGFLYRRALQVVRSVAPPLLEPPALPRADRAGQPMPPQRRHGQAAGGGGPPLGPADRRSVGARPPGVGQHRQGLKMRAEPWFPIGHRPAESLSLRALRHAGPGWQIYEADGPRRVLFASPSLAQSWIGSGLLPEGLLKAVEFGDATYRFLASPAGFLLAPIDALARPDTKADGLAFAIALKESRRRAGEAVSFHDALYVEQHSRLLPTFSVSPRVDDGYVLGTWLSSGVHVSTESARRLASLTGWMPRSALREIIQAAGLEKARSLEGEAKEDARVERALVEEEGAETERRGEKRGPFRLPGRPELERFFNEHIIDIAPHPEKYQALGIHFPPSVVLEGPPGCGKTFAVE